MFAKEMFDAAAAAAITAIQKSLVFRAAATAARLRANLAASHDITVSNL